MSKKPVTHKVIAELVGKALTDEKLRKKLLDDPKEVLEDMGYEPTPTVEKFFKSIRSKGFDYAAENLQGKKKKSDPIDFAGDC